MPARSVHATNINCLSYYGITVGKTERTFAPNDHVTRSHVKGQWDLPGGGQ